MSGDRTPAQAMLHDHLVGKEFQAMGYRYVHLGSWFGPTASIPWADENITAGVTSEFESVLRDTTMAPAVERARGGEKAARTFFERHGDIALFELRQLDRLASAPGPKSSSRTSCCRTTRTSSARMARATRRKRCAPWRRRGSTPGSWRS